MQTKADVRGMTHVALGAVLIAICSWITVPSAVPFTNRYTYRFAVCALLGGKRGLCAVALYMLLGAAGLPVFSGFGAGVGALLGPTGGYILGFAFTALSMWGMEAKFGEALLARIAGMALGLALCYAFGTAWFMIVYARTSGPIGLGRGAFHVRISLHPAGHRQDGPRHPRLRAPEAAAEEKIAAKRKP